MWPILRQAFRHLARYGGSTSFATATLALGISAITLSFGVVDAVLLRPLPYPHADRLVRVYHVAPKLGLRDDLGLSDATYFHLRRTGELADLAAYSQGSVNLGGQGAPERVATAWVAHSLFSTLSVRPLLGRQLLEHDERPGAAPVVLLGEGIWRRRFGARADVIGTTTLIDSVAHEVVGVMAAGFAFPDRKTELWLPKRLDPAATNIGTLGMDAIGLLHRGRSAAQTQARINHRLADLTHLFPVEQGSKLLADAGFATRVQPFRQYVVGRAERSLWLMMASVAIVLAIAWANVANLFLVRAEGRELEMGIRAAIGAGRRHLAMGFLGEGLLVATAAGAIGLGLAAAGLRALRRLGPASIPRLDDIAVNGRVVAFAAVVSLLVGVSLGMVPVLRYGKTWLAKTVREGGRAATIGRRRQRARDALVAVQLALALLLLIGCGLMARSFQALSHVEPGFDPHRVLTFQLALPTAQYASEETQAGFVMGALDALGSLPGVEAAGAVAALPARPR